VRRFDSGVEWYSKNCVILKTQPEGSKPSNLGTSSFIFGGLIKCVVGAGMDEEDEGETAGLEVFSSVVTRCRRSSSFLVT